MPTYEELIAAGAIPGSADSGGMTYEQLIAAGATPGGPPEPSTPPQSGGLIRFAKKALEYSPLGQAYGLASGYAKEAAKSPALSAGIPAYPLLKSAVIDPSRQTLERAKELYDQGNVGEAALTGSLAMLPVVGPGLVATGEDIGNRLGEGDYAGAAGIATGLASTALLPKGLKAAGKLIEKGAGAIALRETKGFPKLAETAPMAARGAEQLFRSAAPTETQHGFRTNIEAAAGDLTEIGKKSDLSKKAGGIINPDMRFDAAEGAIRKHLKGMYEEERAPQITRNAVEPVKAEFGPDAQEGLKFLSQSAGETAGRNLASQVASAEDSVTLKQVDALARLVNKELVQFEGKTGSQQVITSKISKRIASLKALDRELSSKIADTLERNGESGITAYERRSAALHEIADRIGRRSNAVELARRIPGIDWLKTLIGKPTIASASQAAVSGSNPGRLLQKAFQNLGESGLTANRPAPTNPVLGFGAPSAVSMGPLFEGSLRPPSTYSEPVFPVYGTAGEAGRLLPAMGETTPIENYISQSNTQLRHGPGPQRLIGAGDEPGIMRQTVQGPGTPYTTQPVGGTEWAGTSSTPMPETAGTRRMNPKLRERIQRELNQLGGDDVARDAFLRGIRLGGDLVKE